MCPNPIPSPAPTSQAYTPHTFPSIKLYKNIHPGVKNSSCHLKVKNKSNHLLFFQRECSRTPMTIWSPTSSPVVFSFSSSLPSLPTGLGVSVLTKKPLSSYLFFNRMELPRKCPLFLQTKPWYKHRRMCPVKKLMSSGRTGETHKEVVDLDSRTVLWFGDKKGAILRNPSELEPEIWAVWITAVSSTFKPKTRCSLLTGALLAAVPVSPYGNGHLRLPLRSQPPPSVRLEERGSWTVCSSP